MHHRSQNILSMYIIVWNGRTFANDFQCQSVRPGKDKAGHFQGGRAEMIGGRVGGGWKEQKKGWLP